MSVLFAHGGHFVAGTRNLIARPNSPHTVRVPRIPLRRWIPSISPLPRLHLHLPVATSAAFGSVRRSELLEHLCESRSVCENPFRWILTAAPPVDPRFRDDHWQHVGDDHQRSQPPHSAPPLFHLQLRPILHMGRPCLWIVQATQARA